MHAEAYIGLGSNLGDRTGMIAAALAALGATGTARVLRVSHVYESEPWGAAGQPTYANAVALIDYDGEARDLLAELQEIERRLGRVAGERYGPRAIDIDMLLFGDEEWDSEDLTIPHPRMLERAFVATPLLEIAPGIALPDGRPVDEAAAREGRVIGTLGTAPGFEGLTGAIEAEPAAEGENGGEDGAPDAAPPVPATDAEAVGEWVSVGPTRFERAGTQTSTDFDPLFYETILIQAGIPSRFYPHRPNEGFMCAWDFPQSIRLMVPASRAEEARAVIEAVAAAGPEREG